MRRVRWQRQNARGRPPTQRAPSATGVNACSNSAPIKCTGRENKDNQGNSQSIRDLSGPRPTNGYGRSNIDNQHRQRFEDSAGYDSLNASPRVPSSEGSRSASPSMSMNGSISHPPSPEPWLLNTGTSPVSLHNSPSGSKGRHLSVPGLYPLYTGQQQDSDNTLLDTFRTELMPRFPFVVVHPDVTANALNANRPFLMSAIRLVASLRDAQSMRGQVGQIMSHIAENIVVRGQRSLDLLLGMLVVIGWYHCCQLQTCQLNSFLCLAESLIANLGLGQNSRSRDGGEVQPSSEEQRALLGAWYLRSWYVWSSILLDMYMPIIIP